MKFSLCVILLFLLLPFRSSSQTTDEEYNYLTKGYRIQMESGLDMKKGYEFINLSTSSIGSYRFEFKKLIRTNSNTLAGILVVGKSNVSGSTYYYCIPNSNKQLWEKYYSEISLLDEPMTTALAVATAQVIN